MYIPKIKTHKMKNVYDGHYFFILSKGLNAGKPLEKPRPNCFVLFAKNEEERNLYFWLCFGLWQANLFRPFITGSVIPFIKLVDLKQVITKAYGKLNENEFQKSVSVMNDLYKYQENILKQLELIKLAKKSLMYKMLQ